MKAKPAISVISALAFALLPAPEPVEEKQKENPIRFAAPTVCRTGNLSLSGSSVMNDLPIGFYGNYPDQGILEIGGKAGNPYGEEVPEMSLVGDERQMLTIRFEENIRQLEDATYLGRVGYTITMRTEEGLITEEVFSQELRMDEFLSRGNTEDYTPPERGKEFSSYLYYDSAQEAFSLTFDYQKEWKLVSILFYYSDVPAKIENVSLYRNIAPQESIFNAVYDGAVCDGEYSRNIGRNPVYEMTSQYGTVYSRDFLVSSFLAKDENLPEGIHPKIEDPDNYFSEGAKADVGRKFVVYLSASDPYGNVSRVTLELTVTDSRGPNIVALTGNEITASYASDFSSDAFVEEHFVVRDNYDSRPTYAVRLQDGSALPENEIGDFPACLIAKDSFGNETTYDFDLNLIDDVPPIIECDGEELILRQDLIYSREKLLSLFSAYDEIDGDLAVQVVEDTYLDHEDEIGEYIFRVKATDSSGNVAEKTMAIRVEDNEGPTFYVKESFLTVIAGEVPSLTDVVQALIRQNVIENKVYSVMEIVEGDPLNNTLPVGTHRMTLHLIGEDEEESFVSLTVEVVEKEAIEDPITHTMTFWERFCQFWIELWKKIVAFFTGNN